MSQAELAKAMKTSQPAIAKLESGEANFEAETIERAIVALHGRLDISISPAQMNLSPRIPWWERGTEDWNLVDYQVSLNQTDDYRELLLRARLQQPTGTRWNWLPQPVGVLNG